MAHKKIDLKSALIGLLIGIVIVLTIGATTQPKGAVDTYQFRVMTSNEKIIFARINTATGKIEAWQHTQDQIPHYLDGKLLREPTY